MFICVRERERASGGGTERKGDTESEAGSRLSAQSPMWAQTYRPADHDLPEVRHLAS